MRSRPPVLSLRVAAAAVAIHGFASSQLIAHYGYDGGGECIAGLGDLNGDGFADFIVPTGVGGVVSALSGVDRSELWHINIDGVGPFTGYAMANAGDVDGDHTADLVVGTVINGLVRVYSGATQAILYQWQAPIPNVAFGTSVATAGDIDGDGHSDVIVGTQSGRAYVYSGADGHLAYAPVQVVPGDGFGALVGSASDVDGDGFDDFMISAAGSPAAGWPVGHVYVYSGRSGALALDIAAPQPSGGFGTSMCAVGDVDGDGHADIMVGSPFAVLSGQSFPPLGKISLHSGATGSVVYSVEASAPPIWIYGFTLTSLHDIDGDGVGDVVVGIKYSGPYLNRFDILSGRTGAPIASDCEHYGDAQAIVDVGDINSDGRDDIGINGYGPGNHGPVVYAIYLSNWPTPRNYCSAKTNSAGCVPNVRAFLGPSLSVGDEFVISADFINCGTNTGLVWSGSTASTPFGGGTLCVGSNYQVLAVNNTGTYPSLYCQSDNCTYDFAISRNYMLSHGLTAGSTFYAQAISRDPGFPYPNNIGLTDALAITIAP